MNYTDEPISEDMLDKIVPPATRAAMVQGMAPAMIYMHDTEPDFEGIGFRIVFEDPVTGRQFDMTAEISLNERNVAAQLANIEPGTVH